MGDIQTFPIGSIASVNPYSDTCIAAKNNYKSSPGVLVQIRHLRVAFPFLNFKQAKERADEFGLDGKAGRSQIVIMPKLSALARARRKEIWKEGISFLSFFEYISTFFPYGFGYGWLVERVIFCLLWREGENRVFSKWPRHIKTSRIRIHEDAKILLKELELKDEFDYLILAINFSRGDSFSYSPFKTRYEALKTGKQLPLGFAQTGCLLIGDPDRLVTPVKYKIDCSADRYIYDQDLYRTWGLYYVLGGSGDNTLGFNYRDSAYAEPWSCISIATLE